MLLLPSSTCRACNIVPADIAKILTLAGRLLYYFECSCLLWFCFCFADELDTFTLLDRAALLNEPNGVDAGTYRKHSLNNTIEKNYHRNMLKWVLEAGPGDGRPWSWFRLDIALTAALNHNRPQYIRHILFDCGTLPYNKLQLLGHMRSALRKLRSSKTAGVVVRWLLSAVATEAQAAAAAAGPAAAAAVGAGTQPVVKWSADELYGLAKEAAQGLLVEPLEVLLGWVGPKWTPAQIEELLTVITSAGTTAKVHLVEQEQLQAHELQQQQQGNLPAQQQAAVVAAVVAAAAGVAAAGAAAAAGADDVKLDFGSEVTWAPGQLRASMEASTANYSGGGHVEEAAQVTAFALIARAAFERIAATADFAAAAALAAAAAAGAGARAIAAAGTRAAAEAGATAYDAPWLDNTRRREVLRYTFELGARLGLKRRAIVETGPWCAPEMPAYFWQSLEQILSFPFPSSPGEEQLDIATGAGNFLLITAAAFGSVHTTTKLLRWPGTTWDVMEDELSMAAEVAAGAGEWEVLQVLLQMPGLVWKAEHLAVPLEVAASRGERDMVGELLRLEGVVWDATSMAAAAEALGWRGDWGLLMCMLRVEGAGWEVGHLEKPLKAAATYGEVGVVEGILGMAGVVWTGEQVFAAAAATVAVRSSAVAAAEEAGTASAAAAVVAVQAAACGIIAKATAATASSGQPSKKAAKAAKAAADAIADKAIEVAAKTNFKAKNKSKAAEVATEIADSRSASSGQVLGRLLAVVKGGWTGEQLGPLLKGVVDQGWDYGVELLLAVVGAGGGVWRLRDLALAAATAAANGDLGVLRKVLGVSGVGWSGRWLKPALEAAVGRDNGEEMVEMLLEVLSPDQQAAEAAVRPAGGQAPDAAAAAAAGAAGGPAAGPEGGQAAGAAAAAPARGLAAAADGSGWKARHLTAASAIAMTKKNIPVLRMLLGVQGVGWTGEGLRDLVVAAAEEGNLEVLEYLLGVKDLRWTGRDLAAAATAAARAQQWDLLKQLLLRVADEAVVGAEHGNGVEAMEGVEGGGDTVTEAEVQEQQGREEEMGMEVQSKMKRNIQQGGEEEMGVDIQSKMKRKIQQGGEEEMEMELQPKKKRKVQPMEAEGVREGGVRWTALQLQPALEAAVGYGAIEAVQLLLGVPLAHGSTWASWQLGVLVATAAEQQQWKVFEALLGVAGEALTRQLLLEAWEWAAVRHLDVKAVQRLKRVPGVVWEEGDVERAAGAALRGQKWPMLRVLLGNDWDSKIKEEWYQQPEGEQGQQQQQQEGGDVDM